MQIRRLAPRDFLRLAGTLKLADTRSPLEYNSGHIPGAVSLPLFSDDERASVGKTYKKSGRTEAVLEGLKLIGPKLSGLFSDGVSLAGGEPVLMYCWRGGMRSESVAWLLSTGGVKVMLLEGGYKAYRNFILEELAIRRKTIILGGLTGSGKTEILKVLGRKGEQTVDLEGLASHRGSAFGWLGQGRQPATEQFANNLYDSWAGLDYNRPIWLEDESRNIGTVFMPDPFWANMQQSPVIALISPAAVRLPRLVSEYSCFPPGQLIESVQKISKRLGGDRSGDAIKAIETGDFEKAVSITLDYYDRTYSHSLSRHSSAITYIVETGSDDPEYNASLVLGVAREKGLLPC